MRIEHSLPPGFFGRRPIRVLVVGAGGIGSAILMGLPYLDQAMRVWGHPYGLQVSIMDADTVSETNCVRQPFSASDKRRSRNHPGRLVSSITLLRLNRRPSPQGLHL
jgi:ThiF family